MNNDERDRWPAVLGLAIFVVIASFDTLGKYFGGVGIIIYSLLGVPLVFLGYSFVWPFLQKRIGERTALILAAVTFAFLVIEVAVGYPLANSGRFGGGSDVDDALILGAGELLRGGYPYYLKTYLGLPLSPLPGAFLIAIPWVAFGLLPFQNVFWLAVFFLFFRYVSKSSVSALVFLWGILLISPTIHQNLFAGSDYITNTIYVLVAACLVLWCETVDGVATWKKVLAACLLGLTLSSRSNFLLAMPILFVTLARLRGWEAAIRASAVAALAFSVVTLPFWAFDPGGFSPFTTQAGRLRWIEGVLPYSGILIPAIGGALGLALALRERATELSWFLLNVGIVQLYLTVVPSALYAIHTKELNLFMHSSGYGFFGLFFGASGCWLLLQQTVNNQHEG